MGRFTQLWSLDSSATGKKLPRNRCNNYVFQPHVSSFSCLKVTPQPAADSVLTLDMAPNAIDDMYNGCKDEMKTKVEKEFLPNEKNTNSQFKQAWEEAEQVYNTKWKRETVMAKEQFMAIYVYNFGKRQIYQEIKKAVQTQHCNYKTTFNYHSVTFFLTDALQNLNARGAEKGRCFVAYHRVDQYFSQNVLGKEIRFGYFTSTTLRGYSAKERKGSKSCFKIETCYGADISMFGNVDTEALIPPYEVFNVTGIRHRCQQPSLDCEVVYELKSTHALSNLNCALFRH